MSQEVESIVTRVNVTEAAQCLSMCFQARLVPMLSGDPGIGKSSITDQVADKYRLHMIDIRLSQYDQVDLNGFPMLNGPRATYKPMDVFPLEGDPIPKGKDGFL